jgi:hypothetical protein
MEEEREVTVIRVEDAMRPPPVLVIEASESVGHALGIAEGRPETAFLVHRGDHSWTSVTKEWLMKVNRTGHGATALSSVLPSGIMPAVYPDHPLHSALPYLYKWPLVAVSHRAVPNKLQGVLCLQDALRAFRETA